MRPNSLAVLGLGAIGGSLAWQARLAGIPQVIGYDPDRSHGVQALKSGAVHDIADTVPRAVAGADLVVLAAPLGATLTLIDQVAPLLGPGAYVTDVASLKGPVVARARVAGLAARFAGSHPFAGTHVQGWEGARPDLLSGALVYVCVTGNSGEQAVREVMNFWESVLGCHPVRMDPAAHDHQLAWTSHLPQAVASALAHVLALNPDLRGATFGTGMRDTTRLAASPPEVWADILLQNQAAMADALEAMQGELAGLRGLLEKGDRPALKAWLEAAANFRRGVSR
jgi:prephenate dehydrogenase